MSGQSPGLGQSVSRPEITVDRSAFRLMFQSERQPLDCWLTDEGEAIWVRPDGLAYVLTLDPAARCPTCGHHLGEASWHLTDGSSLAKRLFRRGYR